MLWLLVLIATLSPGHGVKRKLSELRPHSTQSRSSSGVRAPKVGEEASEHTVVQSSSSSTLPTSFFQNSQVSEPRNSAQVLGDLFLSNKLSAKDTHDVAASSFLDGNEKVKKLAQAGAWGKHPKNLGRDLMRSLLKPCTTSHLFWYDIPVWDYELLEKVSVPFPFLLPHEILHNMVVKHGARKFLVDGGAFPELHSNLQRECQKLQLPLCDTVALGLHGDGVPYTKRDSMEVLSFNFLAHPTADRVPFTAISKRHLCRCGCKGQHTWTALLNVLKWSLLMLITGVVSRYLPNGELWVATPNRLQPGFKLACHALLLQCRGDWPFLITLFGVPYWGSDEICWRCKANKSTHPFTECNGNASWRQTRYRTGEFLANLVQAGRNVCPLLALPAFSLSCVVLDWLHIVDLGVGADVLGCMMWEAIATKGLLPGSTKAERLKSLWVSLKAWYAIHKPPSMLVYLTESMIRQPKQQPKLNVKGGECRYLIPFAAELTAGWVQKGLHFQMVHFLFARLSELQQIIGLAPYDAERATDTCRKFCTLYAELANEASEASTNLWQLKPKVHLLQEMIEYQSHMHGSPVHYWTYRDESWCGWWAKASKRRGGANTAPITANRLLTRFRAFVGLQDGA